MNIAIKFISLFQYFFFQLFITLVLLNLEFANSTTVKAKEEWTTQKTLSQVHEYYIQGDYNKAILLLNKLLQQPQQIDLVTIHSNLAEIYRHLGQYSQVQLCKVG